MKGQTIGALIGGLVAGLLVGVLAMAGLSSNTSARVSELEAQLGALEAQIASSGSSAPSQFRTVNEAAATSDFLLVTFDVTEAWLTSLEVEVTDELKTQLAAINETVTSANIAAEVENKEGDAFSVLSAIYDKLAAVGGEQPVDACLGVQEDLYTGKTVYLYLQVPTGKGADLLITPSEQPVAGEWQLLDGPIPNSMLWMSACYGDVVGAEEASIEEGS